MASDNFDRADAANLGADWTNQVGSIDIVSNQAKNPAAGPGAAFYSAISFPDNQYSQAVMAGVGANAYLGTSVRASGTNPANSLPENAYFLVWASSGSGQGLYKSVGNSATLLQSISGGLSVSDLIRLEASGDVVRCLKNGTQQGTDTTDAALTAGNPGIYTSQSVGLAAIFDDWEGGGLGDILRVLLGEPVIGASLF